MDHSWSNENEGCRYTNRWTTIQLLFLSGDLHFTVICGVQVNEQAD